MKKEYLLLLISVVVGVFAIVGINYYFDKQEKVSTEPSISGFDDSYSDPRYAINTADLLILTNQNRVMYDLRPLTLDERLKKSAQEKCQDMVDLGYWAHKRPNGDEPWVFIDKQGVPYAKAAENLANSYSTSSEVVNGWMNSPGHRVNLLDPELTHVGFGICSKVLDTYVAQHFTRL